MINAKKLQCLTTANWLIGYAATLDECDDIRLIHKMRQAAALLQDVWDEYEAGQTPKVMQQKAGE
jgi:hypothetical protein